MKSMGFSNQPTPTADQRLRGASPEMVHLRKRLAQAAAADATLLLRGETGTGKGVMAKVVHELGSRRDGPFIACSLAERPDALIASELFGHKRGAFSGATAAKAGLLELASGGTLFFDEIAEISPAMQVTILRLLEDQEYLPVGGTRAVRADVRFVAATHRDLETMVHQGSFREDLYYRLNVLEIWSPPLRARRADIPDLASAHAARVRGRQGRTAPQIDDSAMKLLCDREWAGNVRELLNFIERLLVFNRGDRLSAADVRHVESSGRLGAPQSARVPRRPESLAMRLKRSEKEALVEALAAAGGNKCRAAQLLGIGRRTLYDKLEEHGLHEVRREPSTAWDSRQRIQLAG